MFWLREKKWKSIFHGSLAGRMGFPHSSVGKDSACNAGNHGWIPGLGRSHGEGEGYPLQYSGLKNSKDCIVRELAKSRAQLSDFHTHLGRLATVGFFKLVV